MAQKLKIAEYLKYLNRDIDEYNKFKLKKNRVEYNEKLTCKLLAEKLNITAATITNATLDSKFSLIYNIAEEIYLYYQEYFIKLTYESMDNKCEDGSYMTYNTWYVVGRITENY